MDSKQHYLAKFDWNGNLIKKTGQYGQGPKDLNLPIQLNLHKNRLFFCDSGNRRIFEIGTNLESPIHYKYSNLISITDSLRVLSRNKLVYVSMAINQTGKYRPIVIMDIEKKNSKTFFDRLPKGVKKQKNNKHNIYIPNIYFLPVYGLDRANKQYIITFNSPANPIEFFIYSFGGDFLDSFSYTYDKNYKLLSYIREGKRPPKQLRYTVISIRNLFVYKGHYIVIVSTTNYRGQKGEWPNIKYFYDNTKECVIFDKETQKPKTRFILPKDHVFFRLNEEGLLTAYTDDEDDNPVIRIYQLEL